MAASHDAGFAFGVDYSLDNLQTETTPPATQLRSGLPRQDDSQVNIVKTEGLVPHEAEQAHQQRHSTKSKRKGNCETSSWRVRT
jgi:hypothetical protein